MGSNGDTPLRDGEVPDSQPGHGTGADTPQAVRNLALGRRVKVRVNYIETAELALQVARFNQWLGREPYLEIHKQTGKLHTEHHAKALMQHYIQSRKLAVEDLPPVEVMVEDYYGHSAAEFLQRMAQCMDRATRQRSMRGREVLADGVPIEHIVYARDPDTRMQHILETVTGQSILETDPSTSEAAFLGRLFKLFTQLTPQKLTEILCQTKINPPHHPPSTPETPRNSAESKKP